MAVVGIIQEGTGGTPVHEKGDRVINGNDNSVEDNAVVMAAYWGGRTSWPFPKSDSSNGAGSSDDDSNGEGDRQDSRRGHCRYDAPDSDVFLNPTHGVPREGGIIEGVGEEALTVVLKRPGAPSCSSTTCTTLV